MHNKMMATSLLMAIILSSCSPSIISPTPTFTVIPTATIPAPHTRDGMSIETYQDVRFKNISDIDRSLGEELIKTLWFDESTIWSKQDKPIAQNILKLGMNPGLGIRDLHTEGITGKGVTVAIIDQPLIPDHPEIQGKIVRYHDTGTGEFANIGSMHGPAVTSLLAGENIGTAPDVRIYYVAVPSWFYDAQYYADALNWIIAENKTLPEGYKIRVVSVSSIPSGVWSEYTNTDAWDAAYQRATKAGILVLDCTYEQGITIPCTYDLHDPDNVTKCIPDNYSPDNRVNIPASRTSATEAGGNGNLFFSYQFTGEGGLSWTTPYLAGVLAMGWQINPDLTSAELLDMLFDSAYVTENDAKIINPKAFIDSVKLTVNK